MRSILFLLFFSLGYTSYAQVKPIYFIGDVITTDSTYATSFAIYGKLSGEDLWTFKRYDLNNELMSTGSFKDSLLMVQHGEFIFYQDVSEFSEQGFTLKGKTRFISVKGSYKDGLMEGRWLAYFPDGNVLEFMDYKHGKANGSYKKFNRYKVLQEFGQYVDGKKDGTWIMRAGKETYIYEMDKLISKVKNKKSK